MESLTYFYASSYASVFPPKKAFIYAKCFTKVVGVRSKKLSCKRGKRRSRLVYMKKIFSKTNEDIDILETTTNTLDFTKSDENTQLINVQTENYGESPKTTITTTNIIVPYNEFNFSNTDGGGGVDGCEIQTPIKNSNSTEDEMPDKIKQFMKENFQPDIATKIAGEIVDSPKKSDSSSSTHDEFPSEAGFDQLQGLNNAMPTILDAEGNNVLSSNTKEKEVEEEVVGLMEDFSQKKITVLPSLVPVNKKKKTKKHQKEKMKINDKKGVFMEIFNVALPALGTVLAEPLMSIVDTACVGQISTIQLAALGPNTAIFNFIFNVFTCLGMAMTSILAQNATNIPGLSKDEKMKRNEYKEELLSHSMTLAVTVGIFMTGFLLIIGPTLLRAMGTNANVMSAALPYLSIRALSFPAILITIVSTGTCLGQQDMWTPLKVINNYNIYLKMIIKLYVIKNDYNLLN